MVTFLSLSECIEKFASSGRDVWEAINDCFDAMPVAAVVDKKVFSLFFDL
eukprot:m.47993 g.47993  ORF g.47993 m.47993 type:complete len:50 (+) comp33848_c0_seq11:2390-2539(+)